MIKKSIITLCLTVLAALCFCGISSSQDWPYIDLHGSEMYTEEDLQAAVEVILAEFNTWEGCELHTLGYTSDEESMDWLDYANSSDKGSFDEVAMFDSSFRSPKEQIGAWEADEEYTWSWTLARADKGEWQLLTWGWKEPWLKSEKYSMEDLAAGMDAIYEAFKKMEGTSVRYMKYAGDEFSDSELECINSLDRGIYDECAVFYVWFMSPKDAFGAWEPDMLYSWSFYLGRADKGDWNVITYGN